MNEMNQNNRSQGDDDAPEMGSPEILRTQAAPAAVRPAMAAASEVGELKRLLRQAYMELRDARVRANDKASKENMETFKAGLKAHKQAQETLREELLKLPKGQRNWVMKNQRELYDKVTEARGDGVRYMDYNEFRTQYKAANPNASQKKVGVEWRKYKAERQLPSRPGQCSRLPIDMCNDNPNCSYAVGLKREGCRKARSARKSRKVRRSPKKTSRRRKPCSGARRSNCKSRKNCTWKKSKGCRRSRKKVPRGKKSAKKTSKGKKSAKKCSRGRKKSGRKGCKAKPGPKRSSKRVCSRGRRKGSKACRRKPGPKRSTVRKSR
jgi:hypothetical protein